MPDEVADKKIPEAYAVQVDGTKTKIDAYSIEVRLRSGRNISIELEDCVDDTALVLTTANWARSIKWVPRFVVYPDGPGCIAVKVDKLPAER